ncbi:MAG TPA: SH3 domain-containing protein [Candidatus Dormibacteraeota bacterium]
MATLPLAACSAGKQDHSASGATIIVKTPVPTPSASGSGSVWVLAPVGLNLRAQPSATSARVATAARGIQLDVLGSQSSGGQNWLRIRAHDAGTEGWVLDQPDLVIHRAVSAHFDSGGGWSILFPADWTLNAGTPTTFVGSGQTLLVQAAPQASALPTSPGAAGKDLRDEGPVDVYGATTFLTVYQLNAGGFEYDDVAKFGDPANPSSQRAILFRFHDSASAPDTALFKQLLASVAVV